MLKRRFMAVTCAMLLAFCGIAAGCVETTASPRIVRDQSPIKAAELANDEAVPDFPTRDADVIVVSHDAGIGVKLWMDRIPPPTNEPAALFVEVRPADDITLRPTGILTFDAEMQHHRHGLIQRPIVTPLGDGRYHISNILLHMPGRWEMYFDVTRGGVMERTQWTVMLE